MEPRSDRAPAAGPAPDWPFPQAPVRVRIWELVLFQVVLGALWGLFVFGIHRPELELTFGHQFFWSAIAFLHALGPALLAFVIRDKQLGAGARFARSGRVAMVGNALIGGSFLLICYETLELVHVLPEGNVAAVPLNCGMIPGMVVGLFGGGLNVRFARNARPFLRWAPLAHATLLVLSLGSLDLPM